jgi:hypothetical protein
MLSQICWYEAPEKYLCFGLYCAVKLLSLKELSQNSSTTYSFKNSEFMVLIFIDTGISCVNLRSKMYMSGSLEGLFAMARDMTCQSVLLKFQLALHCSVNDVAMQLLFVNVCPLIILSLW